MIVIPYTTIEELNGIKSSGSDRSSENSRHARTAINWLMHHLGKNDPGIIGQRMTEVLQPNLRADDAILDCCLYFQDVKGSYTVLLSGDHNLCVKALVHSIKTVTYKPGLTAGEIAHMIVTHAVVVHTPSPPPSNGNSNRYSEGTDVDMDVDMDDYVEPNNTQETFTPQPNEQSHHEESITQHFNEESIPDVHHGPLANSSRWASDVRSKSPQSLTRTSHPVSTSHSTEPIDFDTIQFAILNGLSQAMDSLMHDAFDENEIREFNYSSCNAALGTRQFQQILKRFNMSVFGEHLPRTLRDQIQRYHSSNNTTVVSKSDAQEFVDLWGATWLHIAKRDQIPNVRAQLQDIQNRLDKWS